MSFRCSESVDFSLRCAWLLDAYILDQMKSAKKPNRAVRLLFDVLYEKYKPRICYDPTVIHNSGNNHHRLDEEESENAINQDEEMKSERALSQENLMSSMNRKRGHQKSRSDVSGNENLDEYLFISLFLSFSNVSTITHRTRIIS